MIKIGDRIEREFWDRLELKLKLKESEQELDFKGWQAALMRELVIAGAAMTVDGAHQFLQANDRFKIDSETVANYLAEKFKESLLKTHTESMIKDRRRKRLLFTSNIQPDQFTFQVIVHKEEK